MTSTTTIQIHAMLPVSYANGPGAHFVIWTQGCLLQCPHCCNPSTHDPNAGQSIEISAIIEEITRLWHSQTIRGVSITGGEPFFQAPALLPLVQEIKQLGSLGVIVSTGYDPQELEDISDFPIISQYVDVIIAGRFLHHERVQQGLRGSSNKAYLFNSSFYALEEFDSIPPVEITPLTDGTLIMTGVIPDLLTQQLDE